MANNEPPLLTAISSSARQLHSLLRCIAFTSKALVQVSANGIKLSSYESSVLEGHVLLEKKLFTTFRYDADDSPTPFEVSLPALLETLQIFSTSTESSRESARFAPYYNPLKQSAFNSTALGLPSQTCTLSYAGEGTPLTITMTDIHNDVNNFNGPGSVTTTCDLTTYEPANAPAEDRDIPFRRNQLAGKVILQSSWLADALAELATTNPERILFSITPHVGFSLSAIGSLGSAEVSFDAEKANAPGSLASFSNTASVTQDPYADTPSAAMDTAGKNEGVLETFLAQEASHNSYKFAHVKATMLAMKASEKTSIRVDRQGVLSLQFMIEVEKDEREKDGVRRGEMSFVDFRFVPLVDDEEAVQDAVTANTARDRKRKVVKKANGVGEVDLGADENTESEDD